MLETIDQSEIILQFDHDGTNKNLAYIESYSKEGASIIKNIYNGSFHLSKSLLLNYLNKDKLTAQDIKILKDATLDIFHHWCAALMNFISYQWSIPTNNFAEPKLIKYTKVRGKLLLQTYELCKECHSLHSHFGVEIPFKTGYDWFAACWWDFVGVDIEESLFSKLHYFGKTEQLENKNIPKGYAINVYNNNVKKAILDKRSSKITAMKNGENPFDVLTCPEALNHLINLSLKIAPNTPRFKNRYWMKFLAALSKDCKEMRSQEWGWARNENGEYVVGSGRGGRRKTE